MFRIVRTKSLKQIQEELIRKEKAIQDVTRDNLILLDNAARDRKQIKDLENNIAFLVDNLSAAKKKRLGIEKD